MPSRLPDRPDLEHLKKQAKELLKRLRERTPDTPLANAQHALAREYGFASWTKLKAHVESTTSPLSGRWKANLQKSRPSALNPFRMAALDITVAGDRATFASVSVDSSGEEHRGAPTIVIDGRHHAMEYGIGYVATWVEPRTLEVTATKDGHPTGRGVYEVSKDGQALTVSYFVSPLPLSATAGHAVVFDRVST